MSVVSGTGCRKRVAGFRIPREGSHRSYSPVTRSSGVRRKVQIPLSIKSALGIKSKYTSWAWLNGTGLPVVDQDILVSPALQVWASQTLPSQRAQNLPRRGDQADGETGPRRTSTAELPIPVSKGAARTAPRPLLPSLLPGGPPYGPPQPPSFPEPATSTKRPDAATLSINVSSSPVPSWAP